MMTDFACASRMLWFASILLLSLNVQCTGTRLIGNVTSIPEHRYGGLMWSPFGIQVDPSNEVLYISDTTDYHIRKVYIGKNKPRTTLSKIDSIFLDSEYKFLKESNNGKAPKKRDRQAEKKRKAFKFYGGFKGPKGLALDHDRNVLYILDAWNKQVSYLNLTTGALKRFEGENSMVPFASSLAVDHTTGAIYATNEHYKFVTYMNAATGVTRDWPAAYKPKTFDLPPTDIVVSPDGQYFLINQSNGDKIIKVGIYDAKVSFITADLRDPGSMVFDPTSDGRFIYVADRGHFVIKRIEVNNPSNHYIVAGRMTGVSWGNFSDGLGTVAMFSDVTQIAIDGSGRFLYAMDSSNTLKIRKIELIPESSLPQDPTTEEIPSAQVESNENEEL